VLPDQSASARRRPTQVRRIAVVDERDLDLTVPLRDDYTGRPSARPKYQQADQYKDRDTQSSHGS
jgi:hypothetical protein